MVEHNYEATEWVACNLCGGENLHHYVQRGDGLNLVECSSCKLVYLNPRPGADEIHRLYQEGYFSSNHPGETYDNYIASEVEDFQRGKRGYRYFLANTLSRFLPSHKNAHQVNILDVGCAIGTFVAVCQKYFGFNATGVDISREARQKAKELFDVNIDVGDLAALSYPNESFDAITGFELIEHLPDPLSFLKKCYELLKSKGVVYLSTPNLDRGRHEGKKWLGFNKSYEHLYYFDKHTLSAMMKRANLIPRKIFTSEYGQQHPGLRAINPMTDKEKYDRITHSMWYQTLRPILRPTYRKLNELINQQYVWRGLGHTLHIISQKG